ncbi:hypothetical protein NMY22_g3502 [Coprinellus aureogranulatus]|nr:hypothetical protein NMY22_g3502 [Coprinellus aureogranulatus]
MPVVEIATFPASEAFIADPTLLNGPITNILAKADGFISAYVGFQVEDQKTAYLVVAQNQLSSGAIKIQHVEFAGRCHPSPSTLLLTEVANCQAEGGQGQGGFRRIHSYDSRKRLKPFQVIHDPGAYGEVIEEQRSFYLVLGWESVEAHKAVVSSGGPGKEVVAKFLDLVDMTVVHVKFTKTA